MSIRNFIDGSITVDDIEDGTERITLNFTGAFSVNVYMDLSRGGNLGMMSIRTITLNTISTAGTPLTANFVFPDGYKPKDNSGNSFYVSNIHFLKTGVDLNSGTITVSWNGNNGTITISGIEGNVGDTIFIPYCFATYIIE